MTARAGPSLDPRQLRTLRLVAAVACLLAPAAWPYAYFQLLRWLVSIAAGLSAWDEFQRGRPAGGWTFAAMAVLFNPLAPIALGREAWLLVDLAAAAILGFAALRQPRPGS